MKKQASYIMDGCKIVIDIDSDTVEIIDENTSKTLAAVPFMEWVDMCNEISEWDTEQVDEDEEEDTQMDLVEWAKSLED